MSTSAQRTRSRTSRLLAITTTFLVAIGGLIAVPTVAQAASGPELTITPAPRAGGEVTVTGSGFLYENTPSAPGIYIGFGPSGLPGFYGYSDQMDQIENLTGFNGGINSDGTFTLTFTVPAYTEGASYSLYTSKGHGQGAVDTSQNAIGVVPWEALPATATTTTLGASATEVEAGTSVTLTATVAPAADGTVEFFNNGSSLGAPVATSAGTASMPVTLPTGANSITATFTPTDPAAYLGSSTAAPTVVTVTVPSSAVGTATALAAPTPAAPVLLGTEATLSATVTNTDDSPNTPAGTVEFFSIAAGTTDRTSVGSAPLEAGVATLSTSTLAAGGHTFVAVFTPTDPAQFQGSEGAYTTNYGVVDVAAPTPYTPGATAETTTGATANWDWSAYSSDWTKTAEGDATVNDETFELTNGTVVADAGGAVVSFDAVLRTAAYGTEILELHDPALHLNADGSGVWVASVNSGTERVVVATFSGADAQPGQDATRTINFDWEGTTALGTWNAAYDTAWANGFIMQVPSALRAFYYLSGTTPGNLRKAPLPLTVDFEWPAVATATLAVTPAAPVTLGSDVTLTATVAPPNAEGTVEFFDVSAVDGETSLGTADVENGVATFVTEELVAGGHTFRAEYTSTNGFSDSTAVTTGNYGVVDPAQAAVCTPAAGASETLSGVTAEWDWNAYSSGWTKIAGGNVSVDGQTFVLSNGVATVSEDCVRIAFTGTLRTEAYQGFFPPHGQWVELVNPVLTIDSDGNGAWSAGVRSGSADLNTTTSAPTVIAEISGADFPDFTQNSVSATVNFAYAGTTATGTWSAGRDSAWSNAFVLQAPSAIRSFYYASGAGADGNKPPAAISIDWTLAAPTGTVNGQTADARVLQGQTVVFSASPFREGDVVSVTVNSDPVSLPAVTVGFDGIASQSWTVPADFELGAHTVVFQSGTGANARTLSVPFTVEAASTAPSGEPPATCTARAVTGGSLVWEFKQSFKNYIQGPIAHGTFSGGSFTAGSGAINVDAGGVGRVNFQGSIVATGHDGTLNIQIQNPSVQITGPNTGILFGNLVSSGGSGSYVAIANLSFSSVSVSGNTLTVVGSNATLTGAGAAAFEGFYSAGTQLDAVSFSVSLGGEVPCDATTDPVVLATSGAEDGALPAMTLAAIALLIGMGLVRLRRRATA